MRKSRWCCSEPSSRISHIIIENTLGGKYTIYLSEEAWRDLKEDMGPLYDIAVPMPEGVLGYFYGHPVLPGKNYLEIVSNHD